MKNIKYQLYSASGNPTAIIYGQYFSAIKADINKQIFNTNPIVEQIGYIYQKNSKPYFEMMGNEFSGNGCRIAGYSLLNGKNGIIKFNTSGTKKEIIIKIINYNSTLTLSYCFDKNKIIKNNFGFLIKLFGSYIFVLDEKENPVKIKKIINSNKEKNAVGIMFINQLNEEVVKLNPYFYVKKTNTLINETSCGSGSAVAGIYLSWINKCYYNNLEIKQPSGESIFISTIYKNKTVNNISISGKIKKIGTYYI